MTTAGSGDTAPGSGPEPDDAAVEARPRTNPRALLAAVGLVAAAAGAAVGLLVGGSVLSPRAPAEGSADVGFARDMAAHHRQAVDMSVLVRDGSEDPAVRQLALDILMTQRHQEGQMFGWLATWGLPASSSAPPMAWLDDHAHGEGDHAGGDDHAMPGLATDEQMRRLDEATGVEAERLYLALMIPHHEGGVDMAHAALDHAEQPQVRRLAEAVVQSQEAEIALLEQMLAERGGAPDGL